MDLFDKAGVPYPKMDFSLKEWNVDVMLDKATKLTKNFGKPDVVFGVNYIPWGPHGLAYLADNLAQTLTDPEFVPNRQDRRGGAKKASQNSKIPGQMHNNNVVGKRSFTNRRSG